MVCMERGRERKNGLFYDPGNILVIHSYGYLRYIVIQDYTIPYVFIR